MVVQHQVAMLLSSNYPAIHSRPVRDVCQHIPLPRCCISRCHLGRRRAIANQHLEIEKVHRVQRVTYGIKKGLIICTHFGRRCSEQDGGDVVRGDLMSTWGALSPRWGCLGIASSVELLYNPTLPY